MQAAHLYSVAPSEPRQPILPTGMERDGFVALVDTIAPLLGVGNAALSTFRVMIAMTKPRAFKDGSQEPCCYASQCEIAHKRMVNPSRIRAHERELEAAGLIERRTMANGARSGFAGCGVYFTRAIARVHDFLAMRDQLEVDRRLRERGDAPLEVRGGVVRRDDDGEPGRAHHGRDYACGGVG